MNTEVIKALSSQVKHMLYISPPRLHERLSNKAYLGDLILLQNQDFEFGNLTDTSKQANDIA